MADETDPRTMPIDDLRAVVRETYRGMAGAWVQMAVSLRRIHTDAAYKRWGLPSWNAYLASDLPGLDEVTVQQMIQGLGYLESMEPERIEAVLNGSSGRPGPTPLLLDYNAARRLDSLRFKVNEGAVPREEWMAVHRAAIGGEISGKEARRRVARLSKGVRFGPGPTEDPDEAVLRILGNRIAVAASELRRFKRLVDEDRVHRLSRHILGESIVRFLRALRDHFGDEALDALMAEARKGSDGRTKARIPVERRLS